MNMSSVLEINQHTWVRKTNRYLHHWKYDQIQPQLKTVNGGNTVFYTAQQIGLGLDCITYSEQLPDFHTPEKRRASKME